MIPILVPILGCIYISFIPESPRFLVSQSKFDEARKAFNVIAFYNGKKHDLANDFIFQEELD
jgi:hypothetical protein